MEDDKNTRFNIKDFDVKPDPNHVRCVRMHLLLEDRKPVRTVDHDQKKYSEQYTLSCGLEKHKGMGVELRLYDRYYEQNKDVKLAEVANTLFDSIVIDDK